VWDGIVEVLDLIGHPKANRIYAWSQDTGDPNHPKHYVTVLHIPPVVSPQTAVQAAIVQEFRSLEPKKENQQTGKATAAQGKRQGCISAGPRYCGRIEDNRDGREDQQAERFGMGEEQTQCRIARMIISN
jgi:hypothetical protein